MSTRCSILTNATQQCQIAVACRCCRSIDLTVAMSIVLIISGVHHQGVYAERIGQRRSAAGHSLERLRRPLAATVNGFWWYNELVSPGFVSLWSDECFDWFSSWKRKECAVADLIDQGYARRRTNHTPNVDTLLVCSYSSEKWGHGEKLFSFVTLLLTTASSVFRRTLYRFKIPPWQVFWANRSFLCNDYWSLSLRLILTNIEHPWSLPNQTWQETAHIGWSTFDVR